MATADRFRIASLVFLLSGLAACEDGTGPGDPGDRIGVVVNSIDVSLTLFPEDGQADPITVGLAPDGSPVGVSLGGGRAAVPLGSVPAVVLVDLAWGEVERTVALPPGSGASGSAFLGDTLVLVANPNLNTLTPVDVRTGVAGAQIAVGDFPQRILVVGDRVLVLEANLGPDFNPAGPGTVTVLSARTLALLGVVTLTGENPGGAAVGSDGRVYVVASGRFGASNGSVSVVDPVGLRELSHHTGFGDFPFSAAVGPDGRLYVGSFAYGIAVWSPATATFVRSPANAIRPEGVGSVSGLAFDGEGRLHSLRPDCSAPSAVLRLDEAFQIERTVPTGSCPLDLAFGERER
jgi:hypothetical protein